LGDNRVRVGLIIKILRLVKNMRSASLITIFVILSTQILSCGWTLKDHEELEQITLPPTRSTVKENSDWWHPVPGLTWQWQLEDLPVDTSVDADVFDLDLFDTSSDVIRELHLKGRKVICYISVGSWEDWRSDAEQFPAQVLGYEYDGWPGEIWLDIRQLDILAPIMRARLDLCKMAGFDAVEPDNIEIHDNDSGFEISYDDQLVYARWLANEAHSRALAIGLKNAPDMVADSLDFFDFAITEDAFEYGWIGEMLPFINSGKPIFAAEYNDTDVDFNSACNWGKINNVSFILKNRELDNYREVCP
jgi:hypothetical protein